MIWEVTEHIKTKRARKQNSRGLGLLSKCSFGCSVTVEKAGSLCPRSSLPISLMEWKLFSISQGSSFTIAEEKE